MHKWSVRLLVLVASLGLAACGERLEGGAACPVLCSGQRLALRDTIIQGVVLDTTLANFPPRGSAFYLLLANSGDSVESRYVVRFDTTLPSRYFTGTDTVPITAIDSAYIRISLQPANSQSTGPVTFEAYDVDAESEDSAAAALAPLFRADRFLGAVTIDSADLKDTVRIPLDNAKILNKAVDRGRLRVGIRVRSGAPVELAVFSANSSSFPRIGFDPAPADTAVKPVTVNPSSTTPVGDPRFAADFTDFRIPVGGSPLPENVFGVGGPRGRRVYVRFSLPAYITDSTAIIRATLILRQRPAPTYGFTDSIRVQSVAVVASKEVTDLSRAAFLTDTLTSIELPPTRYGLPSLLIPSSGDAERRFDIVNIVQFWRSTSADRVPPALVLRNANETTSIHEAHFYSIEASPELRPRLLITYQPRREFGIP